ncbi:Mu transposase C-terminal domain-containing protein [Paenibacillus sp. ACRSA]|uniref:Mu transposase C-terminal domain-containing protein n=1 Tax=Paenibacillus sp. ACRSA TaxID=2918211 RepID=UPI001EF4DE71|nr:Mu transposase C-terminal domain-containing protein [Paenibacillus sp. ACRSA]MCG7377381.1 Mu transposase C-terminal domain-containing protein [Paenibacillus sp. ACRSA]
MDFSVPMIRYLYAMDREGQEIVARLVHIDAKEEDMYFFDISDTKSGFPFVLKIEAFNNLILSGEIVKVEEDHFTLLYAEEDLTKEVRERRDKIWGVFEPFLSNQTHLLLLNEESRGEMITRLSEELGNHKKTVRNYLRRFWQRGMVKNAFLDDYSNCGSPGNKRMPAKEGSKKRGRQRRYSSIQGEGINIDSVTKGYFAFSIEEWYKKSEMISLSATYTRMIAEFYTETIEKPDGSLHTEIASDKPSLRQFTYWYNTEGKDEIEDYKKRYGQRHFDTHKRELRSDSNSRVIAPGECYQIDATIADVYLRSRLHEKWIIGRPVVYVMIDVYSRLVTGLYAGFEGPSWEGAMMALESASRNKVELCEEYGIAIDPAEWNCEHIPERIICDNAELKSTLSNNYISAFNTTIQVVPPGRGDLKGIVERFFRTVQGYTLPFTPGRVIPGLKERTGRDYRFDGKLDIHQFREKILRSVLIHNASVLRKYNRTRMMIKDDVEPVPSTIWNWGIEKHGMLRWFPQDLVKLNLMRSGEASVTESGIIFSGGRYTSQRAQEENWFGKAAMKGRWKVRVAYDGRSNMDHIYVRSPDGKSFDKCWLRDTDERLRGLDIAEIEYLIEHEKMIQISGREKRLVSDIELIKLEEKKAVDQSREERRKRKNQPKESKAQTIRNIPSRRENEKQLLREEEEFVLLTKEESKEVEHVSSYENKDRDSKPSIPFVEEIKETEESEVVVNTGLNKRELRRQMLLREQEEFFSKATKQEEE